MWHILAIIIAFILSLFTAAPPTAVTWDPSSVNSPYVEIAVIRKVSSNPAAYVLDRYLSTSTPNTGTYSPMPALEAGESVEVECALSIEECHAITLQ